MNNDLHAMAAKEAIVQQLDKLQHGQTEKYLLYAPAPFGLGGQIAGRIRTIMIAQLLGRKAVFLSNEDPPYSQSFEPMCSNAPKITQSDQFEPLDWRNPDGPTTLVVDSTVLTNAETLENLDAYCHAKIDHEHPMLFYQGIVLDWLQPTESVLICVNQAKKNMGIGGNSLGVHLRRGDKSNETAYIESSVFNDHIKLLCATGKFDSIFLASDSPNAKEEILVPTNIRLIFDESEVRHNNANHRMLIDAPDLAEQETKTAIKNILLLASCGGLVGQDNAHFATLAAGCILSQTGSHKQVQLIDGKISENRSYPKRIYYDFRRRFRSAARKALPFMTTSARMQRTKIRK